VSREFEVGLRVGRGSLVFAQRSLKDSLGKWAGVLPYLDRFSARAELELVASINYILGKDVELSPPLKASLASDYVYSSRKMLVSDVELMLGVGGGRGEGKEE